MRTVYLKMYLNCSSSQTSNWEVHFPWPEVKRRLWELLQSSEAWVVEEVNEHHYIGFSWKQSLYTLIKAKEYAFQEQALMAVLLKHIKCPHSSESVKTIMSLKINVWGRRVQKDQAPDPHGNFQPPQHVHITTFLQKQ